MGFFLMEEILLILSYLPPKPPAQYTLHSAKVFADLHLIVDLWTLKMLLMGIKTKTR